MLSLARSTLPDKCSVWHYLVHKLWQKAPEIFMPKEIWSTSGGGCKKVESSAPHHSDG